jgi:uncharacterized membrane protein (UPF0127 family)
MRQVIVHNQSKSLEKLVRAVYCDNFFCQLRGLTFRRRLALDEGLLLVQERDSRLEAAIHMLGVWFDISVVWINADKRVVDVRLARSWRLMYIPKHPAMYVLELSAERLYDYREGDEVLFEEVTKDSI